MVKQALESLFDYFYLDNSYHDKYGSIIQSLNSQKSLGNNQYPITSVETNKVLSNHKFDINIIINNIVTVKSKTITRSIKRTKRPLHSHFAKI